MPEHPSTEQEAAREAVESERETEREQLDDELRAVELRLAGAAETLSEALRRTRRARRSLR